MGTLYYIAKHDETREVFALNKVYHYSAYEGWERLRDAAPLTATYATPDALAAALHVDYGHDGNDARLLRLATRLFRWAGDAPVQFMADHQVFDFHEDLMGKNEDEDGHDDHDRKITGSGFDDDYTADDTFIQGSAW